MRRRHRREDLVRLLEQRTEENLTLRELSERCGIPAPTLGYWASKLQREQLEENAAPSLVPVELVEDCPRGSVTVEVGTGLLVHVEPDFDATHLSRLLDVLASRC